MAFQETRSPVKHNDKGRRSKAKHGREYSTEAGTGLKQTGVD